MGLFRGRGRGSFISKCDPEVVLYLAEAVHASSEFIGASYHKLFQALPQLHWSLWICFVQLLTESCAPGLLNPYKHYVLEDLEE